MTTDLSPFDLTLLLKRKWIQNLGGLNLRIDPRTQLSVTSTPGDLAPKHGQTRK